jgi:pyruvate dehydrogenase (quinone)
MPNMPHLDLSLVGRFALAKVREAVLAVTAG